VSNINFDVALFPTERADETVRLARLAETLGYDGIWVGDSHIIWREMYVLMGAIAAQTKRVAIGSGVTHPHVRHLTLTASGFASLCELAKERIRIGIGIGASGPINIGAKRASTAELEQTVASLKNLLRGEAVEIDGKPMRLMFVSPSEVPIYMAASGPQTRTLAVRAADGIIGGGRKDQLNSWVSSIRAGLQTNKRQPESFKIVSWIATSISPDGRLAREAVKPFVARTGWTTFSRLVRQGDSVDAEDRRAMERLRQEYDFSHHMGPEHSSLVPDRWVDMFAVAGTPQDVKRKIDEIVKSGTDVISVVPYGNKEAVIRDFAKRVLS
jgi:5,10-methylenetetrahydromethanopterin reductase